MGFNWTLRVVMHRRCSRVNAFVWNYMVRKPRECVFRKHGNCVGQALFCKHTPSQEEDYITGLWGSGNIQVERALNVDKWVPRTFRKDPLGDQMGPVGSWTKVKVTEGNAEVASALDEHRE